MAHKMVGPKGDQMVDLRAERWVFVLVATKDDWMAVSKAVEMVASKGRTMVYS